MAAMFPPSLTPEVLADPGLHAERLVYQALKEGLGPDVCVFFRVAWIARRCEGRARDGQIDFVIADPRHGLLCLEVKGGEVSRDGATGFWSSRDRAGKRHRIRNPAEQACEAKYALIDRLHGLPDRSLGGVRVGHAVCFPDGAAIEGSLPPDLPPDIVLFAGDMPRIGRRIEEIFSFWDGGAPEGSRAVDETALAAVQRLLSPCIEIRRSFRTALQGDEAEILRLTDEQMVVLDLLARNRRVAVSGGAGTGKTCLALAKALSLAREGFRTLLTCFNRPLARYLAGCGGDIPGLTVVHFHQFCFDMALAAGVPLSDPAGPSPSPEYFEHEMPAALETALELRGDPRFDAVIVDEAQDFAGAWWRPLLRALADPERGILHTFHDDNQRLYRATSEFPAGLVPVTLARNLRNTQAIHRVARRFYSGGKFLPAGPEGRPVEFIEAEPGEATEAALNRVLHRLLIEQKVPAGDMVVLSGHRRERSPVGRDGWLGDHPCTEEAEPKPNGVLFQTVHRFKGLERPVVILLEMEDRLGNEEIFYVGASRARAYLIVIGRGDTLALLRDSAAPGGAANDGPPPAGGAA